MHSNYLYIQTGPHHSDYRCGIDIQFRAGGLEYTPIDHRSFKPRTEARMLIPYHRIEFAIHSMTLDELKDKVEVY